jgi:type II secretory pathway pseudopilin PulG
VELIFVVLIVLTLTAIAVPLTVDYIHQANVARAIAEVRLLEKEIIIFETEKGYYPGGKPPLMLESMQEISRNNFLDPWGSPYQYRNLAQGEHTGGGKPKVFVAGTGAITPSTTILTCTASDLTDRFPLITRLP